MRQTWVARPTTYRGVPMRSRLEARFAADLDATPGVVWLYEPRAYGNQAGQYLPDFLITEYDGPLARPLFFEVRPTLERAYLAMERMPIIWDSEPTAQLWIAVPDECWFWAEPDERKWHVR